MSFVIKDVTVNWAFLNKKDKFGKWSVKVDVSESFKSKFKEFKAEGCRGSLQVVDTDTKDEKHKEGALFAFTFRRDPQKADFPPTVEMDGKPYEGTIGNGSVCDIQFKKSKAWDTFTMDGSDIPGGYNLILEAIRVKELVEYKSGDSDSVETEAPTSNFDEAGVI